MTLKNRIEEALNRISQTPGTTTLNLTLDAGELIAEITAVDQLACAFERLTLKTPQLDGATLEQLDRVAANLAKRLSYLLESISPIERDRDGCVVQMRSNPPQKDDDGTSYYELVVRRGELSLCRFSKATAQPRRNIPAHVTREVFCRLVADLSATTR